MALDLELELLRAARSLGGDTFTIDELSELLRYGTPTSRFASPLLAHHVAALAESLQQVGLLEMVGGGAYALTPRAIAEIEREPIALVNVFWHPQAVALQLRRDDDG